MQRITITIDDDLLDTIDALMTTRGYTSRSEVVRDLARDALRRSEATSQPDAHCVAALSYVYDHDTRELSQKLVDRQHDHHDLTVATMHVHLDHGSCLEVSVLRGAIKAVETLADTLITQRGVRHGHLHLVPAEIDSHHPHHHIKA